jgi:hypothetical protein
MGMLRVVTSALVATWGLAATAAPASADGPHRYPTYDATPGFYDFKWTGFYVGAHLGGAYTEVEATETDFNPIDSFFGPLIQTYAGFRGETGGAGGLAEAVGEACFGVEDLASVLPFDETTHRPGDGVLARRGARPLHAGGGPASRVTGAGWPTLLPAGRRAGRRSPEDTLEDVGLPGGGRTAGRRRGLDYALTRQMFGFEYNYLSSAPTRRPADPGDPLRRRRGAHPALLVRLNYPSAAPRGVGPPGCRRGRGERSGLILARRAATLAASGPARPRASRSWSPSSTTVPAIPRRPTGRTRRS